MTAKTVIVFYILQDRSTVNTMVYKTYTGKYTHTHTYIYIHIYTYIH